MGLRLRLLFVVILPMALAVGVYGVVRVRKETTDAIEAERRQAAIAASAVRIAVEHTLRSREFPGVQRLAAETTSGSIRAQRATCWTLAGDRPASASLSTTW